MSVLEELGVAFHPRREFADDSPPPAPTTPTPPPSPPQPPPREIDPNGG